MTLAEKLVSLREKYGMDGAQIAEVVKAFVNFIPSRASSSICGVLQTGFFP